MDKRDAIRAVAAALLATLGMTAAAAADPRGGPRSGGRFGGQHGPSMERHRTSFRGHGFGHHRFHARRFAPFTTVIVAPPVFDAFPFYAAPSPTYVIPPPYVTPPPYASAAISSTIFAGPPPAYNGPAAAQPTAPPMPRVVEFPTGRYELRGDGMATPYTWVWIPNPPTAPPAAPSMTPPTGAPGDGLPASRPQVHTWVDKQGVEHWTNRADTVPRN